MVDPDILRAKAAAIRHHVARLRARRPLDVAVLDRDEDARNVVLMDLQQAIQACIDLAVHTCSHEALGSPEGPAAAFALLARAGILEDALSIRLAGAAGLRNVIVHRYGELVMERLVAQLAAGLADLEGFLAAIQRRRGES
ncbi:MAG: DUF86 domain-containing protein [Deltaproteobacteria bacterium]|nr:DUF86 domain-containing protein [Deltaproteobacteria bacterium]